MSAEPAPDISPRLVAEANGELRRQRSAERPGHGRTFALAALEALYSHPAPADDGMIRQLCVCDRNDCYCLETAEIPIRIAAESYYECPACQAGRHVTTPR